MVKAPSTDQFPWAPFQVFQFQIVPEKNTYSFVKTYAAVGHSKRGSTDSGDESDGKSGISYYHYERERLNNFKNQDAKFNKLYRGFEKSWYTRTKYTPDTFTIAIGVVDLQERHNQTDLDGSVYGTIDYELLFELLDEKGFRPLSVLNKNHRKIEKEMESCVKGLIRRSDVLSKIAFKNALTPIAAKWTEKVRDYIAGGDKPSLHPKTTEYFRPKKLEGNPDLYGGGSGIDEALVETGQLLDAIGFSVFVEQSETMKSYIAKKDEHVRREREAAKRKAERDARRAAREAKLKEKLKAKQAKLKEIAKKERVKRAKAKQAAKKGEIVVDIVEEKKKPSKTPKASKAKEEESYEFDMESFAMNVITSARLWTDRHKQILGTDLKTWPKAIVEELKQHRESYKQSVEYLKTVAVTSHAAKVFLQSHGVTI